MQLYLTFAADCIRLPMASAEILQGLIYHALSEDPVYARSLHETGSTADGRAYKLFCFSELSGTYTIADGQLCYPSGAGMEIRSIDPRFITLLFSYFTKKPVVRLGENTVEIQNLRLGDTRLHKERITVKTLSPITVYRTEPDGHTTYFSPEEDIFCRMVESNARRKWMSHYGTEEGFGFSAAPLGGRFTRRATRFKSTFITAWHGRFTLTGTPAALDFLYHTGLGSKNSQGFGMFDIVE